MKSRSKPLYEYLSNLGVLNASEEEILQAKRQYRKEYKRLWKKQRQLHKELRIQLSLRQINEIKIKAYEFSLKPTTYARSVILSAVGDKTIIANRDCLLEILQILSMCAIAVTKNSIPYWVLSDQLGKAEQLLLDYLKKGVS